MKKRQNTNRWKRAASVLTAVAVTCAMVLTSVAPAFAATARATTMKLEKTEGTVSLKTQNGTARRITSGMRLYNGNTLETKAKSHAYVSLDSAKAVKLDQSTQATLRQNGKELELLVKSGKLFFNVSQPLTEKESMNVRTSTMVTGIRGTCGIVEHVTSTTSKLYLLEGKVTLGSGENATTIQGGQTATIVVQPKKETSGGGKPGESEKEPVKKITVEKMTEEKVPVFAIQEIVKDPVLQEKIEKTTELKVEKLEVVLEEAKKAEEAGKDPEKESEKEEEKEKEPEQTIPSGGGSVTVDPAPGNPGTSDPKPGDPTPEEPGKDDPETETPVDPGTPEEPEPDTPVDPGMPEEPDTPKDPTRATLTGNVTFAQLNAALAENDEVILEGAVTLDAGEQLLIPSNKTLAVNGSISGEGTISLGEGSTLANNGTITAADMNDAAALSSRVRTLTVRSVKNSGCIKLSGTYASDAAYTYSEDAVLICGDKVSALYDELMMVDPMGAVTSGTSIKCNYLYGSSLNAYVADYLYERSTTGYVSGSFQRDITVNSDVTVRGAGGIHGGVQLYMSGYTICVADGTLTLHGDINVTSSGSKPTMSLQGGHLKMTGVSETNNAIIHNMGSGYAIAVSNGSTITWENPNMLVAAEGGNGRIIEGVTLNENQQPIVPNFMTVATGTLELTADQTMLRCNTQPTETSLYGEVTLSTIKEAFGEYDKVHIREDATLQIPQTESELLIPAGKALVVWGTQSIPTRTAIQVGDGSKQALLCVTEGSELTAGEIHVSAGSRLEDHGTLNCVNLSGGANSNLINNGQLHLSGTLHLASGAQYFNNGTMTAADLVSDGGASISNREIIKLSGAYTSSGTDSYFADKIDGSYDSAGVLVSGKASTALLQDQLLMNVQVTTDSTAAATEKRVYASSFNWIVINYLNECAQTGWVNASLCKDGIVSLYSRCIGNKANDMQLNLGAYSLHIVSGELEIGNKVYISSTSPAQAILLEGSGSLRINSNASGMLIRNDGGGYGIARAEGATGKVTWNYNYQSVSGIVADSLEHTIQGCTSGADGSVVLPEYVTAEGIMEYSDGALLQYSPYRETTLYGTVTPAVLEEAFQKNRSVEIDSTAVLQFAENDTLTIPGDKDLYINGVQSIPETTTIQVGDGIKESRLYVQGTLRAGEITVAAKSELYTMPSCTLDCTNLTGGENTKIGNSYQMNVSGSLKLLKGALLENDSALAVGGTLHLSEGAMLQTEDILNGTDLTSDGGAVIKNQGMIQLSGTYTSKGTDQYTEIMETQDEIDAVFVSAGESTAMQKDLLLFTEQVSVSSDTAQEANYVYASYCSGRAAGYLEERAKLGAVDVSFYKDASVNSYVSLQGNENQIRLNLGEHCLRIGSGDVSIRDNVDIHSSHPDQTILLSGNGSLEMRGGAYGAWISNNGGGYGIARADDATGKVTWSFQYSGEKDLGITANSLEYTIQGCSMNTDGSIAMPEYVITEGIMYYADGSLYQLYPLRATTLSGEVTAETLQKAYLEYGVITLDEGATLKLNDDDAFVIPGGKILNIYGDQSIPTSITIQVGDGRKETQLNFNGTATAGAIRVMAKGQFDSGKVLNCTELTCAADSKASNNGELNVSGTVHLMSGAYYANYQTLNAQALESEGSATIYNTGYIGLQGTYTSAGTDTYEECGLGVCVFGTASKAMPEGLLLVREQTTPSTNVPEPENYVYASVLNQRVANYLCGRAKTGNVNAGFCRDVQVKSSVNLDVQQDESSAAHYGVSLVLGEFSLEVAADVLTIGSDVSIGSIHKDQTILLSGSGSLEIKGQNSVNAQISNTGGGYVIARANDATGTVFWRDTGMGMCSNADKFMQGCSINAADGTVSMPDYVNVQGMVTYKEGTLGLTNIPSTFTAADEVTTAKLQAALRAYNSVTIDQTAKATMSETDTLTIPSGKVLSVNAKMTQVGSAYSGGFSMNKGSRIVIEPGAYMEVSGIVMGNGTIEARTSSTSGGAALTVHTGGQVVAEEISIGSGVTFTNNGIVDIGALNSAGGATINNTELIKIHTAYKYTTEGVTDTYTGTYASVLISNAESTAMPAGSELLNAYITGDSGTKEHVQYYYADYLNTRAGDYINKIIGTYRDDKQQKLWWDFQKNAPVKSATTTTLTDFNADLGTYSIQVSGKLVLDNQTCGTITGSGTTLFDMQGGTLDLTGTTGTLQSGMTSTGEITPADSYVIKGSQSPYQIYWNNPGLTMSAPNGLNKTVDNLYLNSDGSAVVNPDNAYLGILNEYQLVWDAPTNTLAISPVSGS